MDLARVHPGTDDRDVRTGGQPRRCQIQSSQGTFPDPALGPLSSCEIESVQQRSNSTGRTLARSVTAKDGFIAPCAGGERIQANLEAEMLQRGMFFEIYFFNSIPKVRAIRLTDPVWRPSSAAIFDTPAPALASLDNCWTS